MKDFLIAAGVIFVIWYAMRNGIFAQLGGGLAPQQPRGNWINVETPWGNYAGGFQ